MSILKLYKISAGYGKKQMLFDVSFEVKQGEIVLLIGGNGSGKSTLLKTIYNLVPLWNTGASKGTVQFNGEDITGLRTSALLKKGLLYIPQQNNLFEQMTVKENLEMAGLSLGDSKLLTERIDYSLSLFPSLKPEFKQIPFKMSGGERKILTLAMAMLHKPQMILIDEPYTGLSNDNVIFVRETIRKLNQIEKISFLIVEHRIKDSIELANRIIGLKLGSVFNSMDAKSELALDSLHDVFI